MSLGERIALTVAILWTLPGAILGWICFAMDVKGWSVMFRWNKKEPEA